MRELTPEEKERLQEMLDRYKHTEVQKEFVEYAGFWRRFVASFIDGLLLIIADAIIGTVIFMLAPEVPEVRRKILGIFPRTPSLLSFLIAWIYYAVMESSHYQATIGKMMIGIAVTDMNGNRVSFFKASNRFFAKVASALILYVGFIMAGVTERKQALHDIIARCLVVKK